MNNFFTILLKISVAILKIIFFLYVVLYDLFINFIILVVSKDNITWQIALYVLISIPIIPLVFYMLFSKAKLKTKVFIFFLFSLWLFLPKVLPDAMKPIDIDICLDSGGCWDYIRNRCEKNDQGYCENEKSCVEDYKGIWDSERQYCKIDKK